MSAEHLFQRLDSLGVRVWIDGDRLALAPRCAISPDLVEEIRAHRAEVVEAVGRRRGSSSTDRKGRADECPGPFTARVLDLFAGEIVPEAEWAETVPLAEPARTLDSCRWCGSRTWWRLKPGGPPVCERCHPCTYPAEQVERWGVAS